MRKKRSRYTISRVNGASHTRALCAVPEIRVEVNNTQRVVLAFNKDRSRNTHIHELLVALFHLLVPPGSWLRL